MLLEGGVVYKDVKLAELGHRHLDGLPAEAAMGDIARDEKAAAAFFLDGALRFFSVRMFAQIDDGDIGSLSRVKHRYRAQCRNRRR